MKITSPTLMKLLGEISPSLNETLASIFIGHIVTSKLCKVYTDLQVAFAVLVRKRKFVDCLSEYGVTSSYSEVLRF